MSISLKQIVLSVLLPVSFLMTSLIISPQDTLAAKMKGYELKSGDILISSKGGDRRSYTGHSGIVYKDKVIDIHPRNKGKKPTYMSFDKWIKDFKTTKVVRYKDSKKAKEAGKYAWDNYIKGTYKNRTYDITSNPKNRNYIYCSELVWQSYYYGPKVTWKHFVVKPYKEIIPDIVAPYDYLNESFQKINGFKTAKTIAW
ncbi:C40 family peptidase [Rummeliibacillus pycnus]|uniref:YiiX/YebB-like N1pC/P60 family cysteine hydrolase n=1 Tax=Rummeliibacillus pycnus TaxID=101070 RepID=UPI000C9B6BAA|nr:YiiX/YebB-like N1pC/P60 family cysteine hydrolase [Rummeliibacillus pycnus]